MTKLVDIIRWTGDGRTDSFSAWFTGPFAARILAGDRPPDRVELNVVHPGSTRISRSRWPDLPADLDGVVSRHYRGSDGRAPRLDTGADATVLWSFEVRQHVGIDGHVPTDPATHRTVGVKHVALLCGTVDAHTFRDHYRHHVELVVAHMPVTARYVQNDVVRAWGEGVEPILAISELSFRSDDDYANRYVHGEQGAADFRAQEGFLDLPRSIAVQCTEYVLTPAGT